MTEKDNVVEGNFPQDEGDRVQAGAGFPAETVLGGEFKEGAPLIEVAEMENPPEYKVMHISMDLEIPFEYDQQAVILEAGSRLHELCAEFSAHRVLVGLAFDMTFPEEEFAEQAEMDAGNE